MLALPWAQAATSRSTDEDIIRITTAIATRVAKELIRCHLIGEHAGETTLVDADCQKLARDYRAELDNDRGDINFARSEPSSKANGGEKTDESVPRGTEVGSTPGETRATENLRDIDATIAPSVVGRDTYAKSSALSIQATNQNSQVGITLKKDVHIDDTSSDPSIDVIARQSYTVSFAAPINKTDPSTTNIATLDGLANAFKFSFGFQRAEAIFKNPKPRFGVYAPGFKELCLANNQDPDSGCDLSSPGVADTGLYDKLLPFYVGKGQFYGANVTVGYNTESVYQSNLVSKKVSSNVPWAIGGYYAFYSPTSGSALQLGAEVQHAYKPQESSIRCPTLSDQPVKCVSGTFARSGMAVKQLAYLEWRRAFTLRIPALKDVPVAIDAKLTHDFKSGDNGLDVPFFLFANSDNYLVGGVRLGWTNTDHFSAGVFIASPFSISPR